MSDVMVAKIGGSTLGADDTALEDIVALQHRGLRPVVVHGGGALISDWLKVHNVPTRFERGLRVTDARTLDVVVAVLAGLVNKRLVAALTAAGGRAVGVSGADGGLLKARLLDEKLGYVGEVAEVDMRLLLDLLDAGFVPVVAPIAVQWQGESPTGQLLNINADTAAGAVAKALAARWLVFLTDVPGIRGISRRAVGFTLLASSPSSRHRRTASSAASRSSSMAHSSPLPRTSLIIGWRSARERRRRSRCSPFFATWAGRSFSMMCLSTV